MSQEARARMERIAALSASVSGSLKYIEQEQRDRDRAEANIAAEQERVTERTKELQALVGELDQAPEP